MAKKSLLTRILAVLATVLVWFPLVATIVISGVSSIGYGVFRFDYLMPAELFPAALIGGGLLLWAALRAHSRRALVIYGFVGAVAMLVGGQALAVATGLATGDTEPVGWPWALVVASLITYTIALLVMGVAGLLLLGDLFKHDEKGGSPAVPAA